jgi:hypothetical protein
MIIGREDIPTMLDSLQELFQEHGDTVTPTLLVNKMEQKLRRRLPMHVVAYLYTSLGFVTKRIEVQGNNYCIIPNFDLLAEKRAQFCNADNNSLR